MRTFSKSTNVEKARPKCSRAQCAPPIVEGRKNIRFSEMIEELKNTNEYKIIFINSGAFYIAIEALVKIRIFLKENLELELNSKTQIFKNKQGVNFCGYKINEYRLKIRDRGKKNLKNKIK